eukprot:gene19250-23012_t
MATTIVQSATTLHYESAVLEEFKQLVSDNVAAIFQDSLLLAGYAVSGTVSEEWTQTEGAPMPPPHCPLNPPFGPPQPPLTPPQLPPSPAPPPLEPALANTSGDQGGNVGEDNTMFIVAGAAVAGFAMVAALMKACPLEPSRNSDQKTDLTDSTTGQQAAESQRDSEGGWQ